MKHAYHSPPKELSAYIRTVLTLEGTGDGSMNELPAFTNGIPALCCKTEKDANGSEQVVTAALFGGNIPADFWNVQDATTIVVYFFKPFALTSLFHVEANKLAKHPIELRSWSPHVYNALHTQLVYAGTLVQKTDILDNLLLQQHLKNHETFAIIQYATDVMMTDPSNDILAEILTKLNLSERTFQRIFKKYVGVTATQYRRICQFQGSFDQLRSKQFDKMSDVAFDNGFSDQSHFIRSFKEFTDTTPNDYLNKGLKGKK
ncbi:helix-turn-helix domain-containing protein [Cytophaga aurantiaca]|uniref:helix-turn-helix domain-containing protein n=1 Tax=Cytophaga aurantiaca TaxID=29530 RepID=UPI000380197D|nr:AraC family transcriptional regulator [Cytophaga aurantiaca]